MSSQNEILVYYDFFFMANKSNSISELGYRRDVIQSFICVYFCYSIKCSYQFFIALIFFIVTLLIRIIERKEF